LFLVKIFSGFQQSKAHCWEYASQATTQSISPTDLNCQLQCRRLCWEPSVKRHHSSLIKAIC